MPQEIDCWCWMKELYSPATGVSDACLNLSKGPGRGRLSLLGLTTARLWWHNSPPRGLRVPDFFQDKSINGFAIICTHCIVPNLVLPESRTSGRFILFKKVYLYYCLCECIFCLHVCLWTTCKAYWCPRRPGQGVTFPETGVKDCCKMPCGGWELNLGSL